MSFREHAAWLIAAVLLAIAWGPEAVRRLARPSEGVTLVALDVGNGSGQFLLTRSATYVFDLGTLYNRDAGVAAADALRAMRAPRVAGVFLSHTDLDHYSGIPTLLEAVPDADLWSHSLAADQDDPRGSVRRLLDSLGERSWGILSRGDRLDLSEFVIDVLHPPADVASWRPNDRSLVLRVSAHGRRILFPGDIESQAMREMLDAAERGSIDLRADVLVAPHHGAVVRETRSLLEAVGPEVIVISSARDTTRFEALARDVLGEDTVILSTSRLGAVRVELRPNQRMSVGGVLRPSESELR